VRDHVDAFSMAFDVFDGAFGEASRALCKNPIVASNVPIALL
jgi:hypothetical protein